MHSTDSAEVLVTVKAYPQLSRKSGEVVCVAGVRLDRPSPEWIRLFPVHYRDLDEFRKFKKYDVVRLDVRRGKDARPESFLPMQGTIEVLRSIGSGKDQLWSGRRALMGDLVAETTMCRLQALNTGTGRKAAPSLGLVKPEVLDVLVEKNEEFAADKQALAAMAAGATLFSDAKQQLEPSPFVVKYRYRCAEPGCDTHTQSLIDWEVGEAGRKWSSQYSPAEVPGRIREKFLSQLCGQDRDTHFFVGNTHLWLGTFMVLGVFWPKRDDALSLF